MNYKSKENKRLVEAILSLKKPETVHRFLRDLLTQEEIDEFAKRFKAAEMLSEKKSYLEIKKATGFSSTTIARVSKWLSFGEGGYKEVIANLNCTRESK